MARNGARKTEADVADKPAVPVIPPKGDVVAEAEAHANGLNGNGADDHADLNVLLDALNAASAGDFSVRLPRHQIGIAGKIADAFNTIVSANERMASQLERVGEVVGR